jgi:hypothetical protein
MMSSPLFILVTQMENQRIRDINEVIMSWIAGSLSIKTSIDQFFRKAAEFYKKEVHTRLQFQKFSSSASKLHLQTQIHINFSSVEDGVLINMPTDAQIAGGHKANLKNPNTSEESKQHSREVLDGEYNGGDGKPSVQNILMSMLLNRIVHSS